MNISIKATNLDLTPAIKKYAEDKVAGLAKLIEPLSARIELERDRKHRSGLVFRAETMLKIGGTAVRADAAAEDMYAAIDLMIPKLREQISKFKDRKDTLRKRGARSAKLRR